MANHIPYGYKIENGVAVIEENQANQVRAVFHGYLSGLSLTSAANAAGLSMKHPSVRNMLRNRHYLGDDFYPAIIDHETFVRAEEEMSHRAEALGRVREPPAPPVRTAETTFFLRKKLSQHYNDPFQQAAYVYSMIESEAEHG